MTLNLELINPLRRIRNILYVFEAFYQGKHVMKLKVNNTLDTMNLKRNALCYKRRTL